jgi:predicted TPR repeat methyltransferase
VANQAIALEPESSEGHFQRACALARLGQSTAAMAALNRSLELEPFRADLIAEERDLKTLRALPAFKKLVAESEKQQ